MSMLFTSKTIGDLKIDNRFVHSATYEAVSKETGEVSCVSCNRCMAAMPNNIPIRCYHKGFPD